MCVFYCQSEKKKMSWVVMYMSRPTIPLLVLSRHVYVQTHHPLITI